MGYRCVYSRIMQCSQSPTWLPMGRLNEYIRLFEVTHQSVGTGPVVWCESVSKVFHGGWVDAYCIAFVKRLEDEWLFCE